MNAKAKVMRFLPYVLALAVLLSIIAFYCAPQFGGATVAGGDVVSATAWSQQVVEHHEKTGEWSRWNPSMFSGMPWWLLSLGRDYNLIGYFNDVITLMSDPPMGLLFKAAIVGYVSLILLGMPWYIALLGTVILSLNVNNMVLLEAGHQSKLGVIAVMPLVLAGYILSNKGDWLKGGLAMAIGVSLAIWGNHIQMLYYFIIAMAGIAIVFLVDAIRKKQVSNFFKWNAIALVFAILGALSNYSMLVSSKSFSEDTMRGKPILTQASQAANSSSSTKDGLDWNYAMQWSNEMKDIVSLLIPRFVGGSSYEEVSANSKTGKLLRQNGAKKGSDNTYQAPMYWGGLNFTSGPYYTGIIAFALFLLALFLLPRRMSVGLGIAALIILILTMGKNASWFNKTLFDYLPLMNKFRTPNSAMVLFPSIFAIAIALGLKRFIELDRDDLKKPVLYTSAGVIGFLVICALFGGSFLSFESGSDSRYSANVIDIFKDTRQSLMVADSWRAFAWVTLSSGLLFAYLKSYINSPKVLILALAAAIAVDLYSVNLSYLDKDNWEKQRKFDDRFALRPVDNQIMSMEPKGRGYYRVLDIPNMQSSLGSYHHNTIGGYHAAKLQRYQDMLDYYINKGDRGVLNMLNAKYTISRDNKLSINNQALGSAWTVNTIQTVKSADAEIKAVGNIDPGSIAIINESDFDCSKLRRSYMGGATIEMTDYLPNKWTYSFNSDHDQFVVFSEVWYDQNKGMKATIDGKEVDTYRINYILRGMEIPSGKHIVEWSFKPKPAGRYISLLASLAMIFGVIYSFWQGRPL